MSMKNALKKMLKNYVFKDMKIEDFEVQEHETDDDDTKKYEVNVYFHGGTPVATTIQCRKKIKDIMSMMGFTSLQDNLYHWSERDKVIARVVGTKIKPEDYDNGD